MVCRNWNISNWTRSPGNQRQQILGNLVRQPAGDLQPQSTHFVVNSGFLRFHLGELRLVTIYFRFGRKIALKVARAGEDAAQRVIILLRDRIVLVIVAARARDGEAQEAAGERVDFVVAFVGARLNEHHVVAGKPGA